MTEDNTRSNATAGIMTVPWIDGLKGLSGYTCSGPSPAAMGYAFDTPSGAPGFAEPAKMALSGTTDVQWFQSVEQLSSILRVKSGLSAAYGLFSGGAAENFVRNININTYSIYLVIYASYSTDIVSCDGVQPALLPEALALTASQFRAKYGDYFVIGKKRGGEFIAVLELTANTSETKDKLIAATQFDVKSPSVSVKSNLSAGISKALSIAGVSMRIHVKEEGVGTDPINLASAGGAGLKKIKRESVAVAKKVGEKTIDIKKGDDKSVDAKKADDKTVDSKKADDKKTDDKKPDDKKTDDKKATDKKTDESGVLKKGTELEAPKVDTDDEFIDDADVSSYEVDENSPLIGNLLQAADNMKAQVAKHGVDRFAIVKPYQLLPTSPLDEVIFSPNGKEEIYERLEQVYARAKFIRDSADYAIDAIQNGNAADSFNQKEPDLQKLRTEMNTVIGKVLEIDQKLKSGEKVAAVWDQVPTMPDTSRLPVRYRAAVQTRIEAPIITDPEQVMADLMKAENELTQFSSEIAKKVLSTYQDNCKRASSALQLIMEGISALKQGMTTVDDVTPSLVEYVQTNRHQVRQKTDDLRQAMSRQTDAEVEALKRLHGIADKITGDDVPSSATYNTNGKVGTAMADVWSALDSSVIELDRATRSIPGNKGFAEVVGFNEVNWSSIMHSFKAAATMWSPRGAGG